MGYLALSEPVEKQDNLFRRIFWPGNGACDVDALGQRGFWLCASVGTISFAVFVTQGHWLIGLLTLAFYWLGGVGVREHSTLVAVLVASAFLLNQAASLLAGVFPGVAAIAATVLLFANIRGTQIAARWVRSGDPELFPDRLRETWRDRLVDQLPALVWPKARVFFFGIASIYLLLDVFGTVMLAKHPKNHPGPQQEQRSISIKVKPRS